MTEYPGPGRRRALRIGDAEREQAVTDLGEHFAAGRLSEEEHAERTEKAYQARTQADLDALFDDLPGERGAEGEQGPPWAQHGRGPWGPPPWAAASGPRGGRPFGRGWRWLPVPFLVLAAIGTACALAHGFFPFFVLPLLVLAGTFFVLGTKGHLGGPPRPQNNG